MYAADVILPEPLGAKLKIFLEQHIGLRAYYPATEEFYESVRSGHLERPLPLDAVEDLIRQAATLDVTQPGTRGRLRQGGRPMM